jgi:GNAT superfamily N-acetyltransferase
MTLDIRILGPGDAAVLGRVAADVFDGDIDERWTAEFLADPRHHLAVALDGATVVGMASAVHHVHPDKAPQLWINEVGVAPTHRGRGIGRRMLGALLERAQALRCTEAWVLTDDPDNAAAHALYASVGGTPTPACSVTMYTIPLGDIPEGEADG